MHILRKPKDYDELLIRIEALEEDISDQESERDDLENDIFDLNMEIDELREMIPEYETPEAMAQRQEELYEQREVEHQQLVIERRYGKHPPSVNDYWTAQDKPVLTSDREHKTLTSR